jgi:hypothetical protein
MGDARKVFVVHGRNAAATEAMYLFLRAIGLDPIEWDHALKLAGSGSPYNGEVVDAAFAEACAVVVLMTGEDVAHLNPSLRAPGESEEQPRLQPRPNVLIEAGMAMQKSRERTVLVEIGLERRPSDFDGLNSIRMAADSAEIRHSIAERLRIAGCAVNTTGKSWLTAGDFSAAVAASKLPQPTGRPEGITQHRERFTSIAKEFEALEPGDTSGLKRVKGRLEIYSKAAFGEGASEYLAKADRIHFVPNVVIGGTLRRPARGPNVEQWNKGQREMKDLLDLMIEALQL